MHPSDVRPGASRRPESEHLEALIANSVDLIFTVDAEGHLTYASPAAQRILGYPPEGLLGTAVLGLVHPDDLARISEAFQAVVAGGTTGEPRLVRTRHADGSWRWLELVATDRLADPGLRCLVI